MRYMDRLLTSRIAIGLLGPMSYVASLCISVGTYHTLIDQDFIQQLAPNVSTRGQSRAATPARYYGTLGRWLQQCIKHSPAVMESAVVLCTHLRGVVFLLWVQLPVWYSPLQPRHLTYLIF